MKNIIKSILSFMNSDSYHNTNNESGATLASSNKKAVKQEVKVLEFFKSNSKSDSFSPEDVLQQVDFGKSIPITSVRRAMTNLTNSGHLKKTSIMKQGQFGKKIHTWQINDSVQE